jgi:hypothetical protein
VHGLPCWHAPAWQLAPGPQSLSAAHALHLPAWQTWPVGHCLSFRHSGAATHALALQRLPAGHCASSVHSTHLPAAQTWGLLQSLSTLQPGLRDESPQLARAKPRTQSPTAASAGRSAPPGAVNERCMVWKLNSFGTLVNSALC